MKQSLGLFSIEMTLLFLQASCMNCAVSSALGTVDYNNRYLSLLTGVAS